jgi:ubiquinone/menaquinone biosynthesis C-methylase UbiE
MALSNQLPEFMTGGPTWAERAHLGELKAVISPTASDRGNEFHHSVHLYAAKKARAFARRGDVVIDFGCGTGRFLRFFGASGFSVVGTEITFEMLSAARSNGLPDKSSLLLTDGISIPVADASIDMIWCCAVLRYSLFNNRNIYQQIAREMRRVLKPGGSVINLEMHVDSAPQTFTDDFEAAGFTTRDVRILKRYGGIAEDCLKSHYLPAAFVSTAGHFWAALHYWFDKPERSVPGLRDYLFVWSKTT